MYIIVFVHYWWWWLLLLLITTTTTILLTVVCMYMLCWIWFCKWIPESTQRVETSAKGGHGAHADVSNYLKTGIFSCGFFHWITYSIVAGFPIVIVANNFTELFHSVNKVKSSANSSETKFMDSDQGPTSSSKSNRFFLVTRLSAAKYLWKFILTFLGSHAARQTNQQTNRVRVQERTILGGAN